ncbi:MAG: glycosyltransferase, partial [Planctomycetota bacterium]
MRICILAGAASPFGAKYANAFGQQGHEVSTISISGGSLDVPGAENRVVCSPDYDPTRARTRAPYFKAVLPTRKAVRELRPDILFAIYISSGGVLACLSGHPRAVISARGGDVNTHVNSRIWRAVFRWMGRKAALVHTVSEPLADTLRQRVGIAPEKVLACPFGVDTHVLGFVRPEQRPGRGRILCTRSHKPVYDHATLARALSILKSRG